MVQKPQSGSETPESVALILRNSGSQSPDRWLWGARNNQLEEIREEAFSENAKEVPDLLDKDCLQLMLRHTMNYIGEEWVIFLIFRDGEFQDLWLEHARIFTQKSLLKDAKSNPRLRNSRVSLYSKLKEKLIKVTGETGEQITNNGNLLYTWAFPSHGAMLVQDNNIPAIVISVQYFDPIRKEESGETEGIA